MSNRTFYKTIITVEVLSEDPIPNWMKTSQVLNECANGEFVLAKETSQEKKLTSKEAVGELYAAGSEPGFFGLDENGEERE